jgi:hypothetical protein
MLGQLLEQPKIATAAAVLDESETGSKTHAGTPPRPPTT